MAIEVRMPRLSDNMEEGTIVRWHKRPGDLVRRGEPLAEVETEKADVELEASDSGVLREIRVAEGQTAAVGDVIAILAAEEEALASQPTTRPQPQRAQVGGTTGPVPGIRVTGTDRPPARTGRPIRPAEGVQGATAGREAAFRGAGPSPVRASPLAWRLAEEAGINLADLKGSGPGGRIVKRDVETALEERSEEGPRGAGAVRPLTRREEPSRMRRVIARRMADAKRDIPHFYIRAEIDMSEAMRLRESIKQSGLIPGLTVTHLLMKGLALTLVRHPRLNASWRDAGVEFHEDVNIGVAVAVEDGLVVPVLHQAQGLSLRDIAARASALAEKARSGKFSGDDLAGGTFSLSNVGMLDVDELVAVINPPQAAVLAVGAVKERPVVRQGQVVVAQTMRATLSCDHRVLNGIEAGEFLADLKALLENPVVLILA